LKLSAKPLLLCVLPALLLAIFAAAPQFVTLADPLTPTRQKSLLVSYTAYSWWLLEWSDSRVVCTLTVDHEGLPTHPEIREACGEFVYQEWSTTGRCEASPQDSSACEGIYLHLQGSAAAERTIVVDLPRPSVEISLGGCDPQPPDFICHGLPSLILKGIEPLANETITDLRGMFDGLPFHCPSNRCDLPLRQTSTVGSELVFWGESSFGDTTEHYKALVRVLPAEASSGEADGSYVDVLSSQWREAEPASCSMTWNALPPPGGPPAWLSTPDMASQLLSYAPYNLLAGILISNGLVGAEQCADGGLLDTGAASACGMEASRTVVAEWQNRFDQLILDAARSREVPAQLMKNLFAKESQFWPGSFDDMKEVGLGQLTENGADTALLWNPDFYSQFCPLVLDQGTCSKGYVHLLPGEASMLRGALVVHANASCEDCAFGIDLSRAGFSIDVFAETLLANCEQVGRMVRNVSGEQPGRATGYEDLWRLTLANYNAGPGCVSTAMKEAWRKTGRLSWETVSSQFSSACAPTIGYVEQIARTPAVPSQTE